MTNSHDVWSEFDFYFSTVTSQKYLQKAYEAKNITESKSISFENTYRFIYYLEHGKSYLSTAKNSPMNIKPMLLFYGYIQLLKACLVVTDPNYPENTQVLAHGVTSRKKKRQNYEFILDEVKIQKNGLFSHLGTQIFSHTFSEGEKYIMKDMLFCMPELHSLVEKVSHKKTLLPLQPISEHLVLIPTQILDHYHMSEQRFIEFAKTYISGEISIIPEDKKHLQLSLIPKTRLRHQNELLKYHIFEKKYYLPFDITNQKPLSEILQYYLVLYNLSMLSRYETEWWGELLHSFSNTDYPFIIQFTELALQKIPFLIMDLLNSLV